jgi:hypothetical protein
MRALVIYESMFGSTRTLAEAIADGLRPIADVRVVRAAEADSRVREGVDLIVAGAPTHAWSMPRANTRRGAPSYAAKPGSGLVLEPGANEEPGVREWLKTLTPLQVDAAAFDTRINKPRLITGSASRAIGRALARRGAHLVAAPNSFLVDKRSHLIAGEVDRAREWGVLLSRSAVLGSYHPGSSRPSQ